MLKMFYKSAKSDTTRARWIVKNTDTGEVVAKSYTKPTTGFLTDMCEVTADYRRAVNTRCIDKGIDRLY